jgi:DNA repair exonuclease SbcCD ATPase subunit
MGLFDDNKKSKQLEYLEEERRKLWGRVTALEATAKDLQKEVSKKASDSEKEAAQSSKKAAEFKNKAETRADEAATLVGQINDELTAAKKIKEGVEKTQVQANAEKLLVTEVRQRLEESEAEYEEKLETLDSWITKIDEFLDKYPELDDQTEKVDSYITEIEENLEKSSISLNSLNKRKKDIDDLHREIFGYIQKNDDGTTLTIGGKKEELESSYEELSTDIADTLERINEINNEYTANYAKFEEEHTEKYESLTSEIENLLPKALTAGLSAAFSSKKEEEVTSSKNLQKRFTQGIYALLGVSLLPVAISVYFLYDQVTLEEVIDRVPRLVLAIIPMYIPVLWFTYSANKKLNLSKRLIEEYAHKEVLSKTYEGLSKQIESISDSTQSEELKFRLLANFLQVSSENPGKLISNYEASDHPIMEALEQSYKFQIAIDRLEGIPGLGKVAAILETKAKRKLDTKKAILEKPLNESTEDFKEEDS